MPTPNEDASKLKATWDSVTKQIKITEDAVKSLGSAQEELLSDFAKASQNNVDYYKEIIKHLSNASKEEGGLKSQMAALGDEVDLTSKKMKPIVEYISTSIANGKTFKEAVSDIKTEFAGVVEQAGKTSEMLEQMTKLAKGLGAGDLAKLFTGGKGAFDSFKSGFSEIGKIATGEAGAGAGLKAGMGGIFGGLEMLREITEPFRRGWSDVNKQILDINSNVGKLGDLSGDVAEQAGSVAMKYNMSLDEVMKLDVALAKIGTHHESINKTTDDILARYKEMPSLAPEKQIDMMSQYMSKFGMDSTKAGFALGNLFDHAQKIRTEMGITNISSAQFLEKAQGLEIASRAMGYNFGDATGRLEIMAKLMKGASEDAIDWEGASKATSAVLQIGQGNLGMQAYMMQQFAPGMKGGTAQQELGAFALGQGRQEAQLGMLNQMMTVAGYRPGEDVKGPRGQQELAGQIILAFKGMGMSLDDQTVQALTKAMSEGPKHFQEELTKTAKEQQDKLKEQTDANKNQGMNIAALVSATTTGEDSIKGWLAKIAGATIKMANIMSFGGFEKEEAARKEVQAKMEAEKKAIEEAGPVPEGGGLRKVEATAPAKAFKPGMGPGSYNATVTFTPVPGPEYAPKFPFGKSQ